MSRRPASVEWNSVPLAARIEAHRLTILRNGYERDSRPTTIYCVQEGEGGPVKIGRANNLKTRLGAMQSGNHRRLRLVAAALLPQRLEKQIHYELDEWRVGRSEWFKPVPEVFVVVSAIIAYGNAGEATTDGRFAEISPTSQFASFTSAEKEGFEPSFDAERGAMRPHSHNAGSGGA